MSHSPLFESNIVLALPPHPSLCRLLGVQKLQTACAAAGRAYRSAAPRIQIENFPSFNLSSSHCSQLIIWRKFCCRSPQKGFQHCFKILLYTMESAMLTRRYLRETLNVTHEKSFP